MRDYRERTIVSKNRPRKSSGGGLLAGLIVMATTVSFLVGVGTGWFFFKFRAATTGQSGPQHPQKNPPATSPPAQTAAAPPAGGNAAAPTSDPALTFYETLPRGGKLPLGSGINPSMKNPAPAPKAPVTPAQTPQAPAQPTEPAKSPAPAPAAAQSKADTPARGGKYTVQVASCQTRKEADELRARLAAKGMDAYVADTTVSGKGVWYRVRVGRHLEHSVARETAAKAGKGAMVIPE